jgi:glutathione synthase
MNLLVLTDHSTHSEENSIYLLLREMLRHPLCERIDVASRGIDGNKLFFEKMAAKTLYGTQVSAMFSYREDAYFFKKNLMKLALRNYDAVLMRLPYPVPKGFWAFLETTFKHAVIVNKPMGIEEVGNKAFMLNFPDVCPPLQHCVSIDDIETFRQKFPIVLKPVKNYGGKGIVKIEGDKASVVGGKTVDYADFIKTISGTDIDYLGVQFLKNVGMGDKRIVVCNGEILGASLRTPKKGSWICNISQGGSSWADEADVDEQAIVKRIDPVLQEHGVIFYGIDTLVNDDGKRVLSEINTASIGGIIRIEEYSKRPVMKRAAELLWDYFSENS